MAKRLSDLCLYRERWCCSNLGVIRNEEYDLVNFEFSETAIIKMTFEDLVYDCLALTRNKRCLQHAKIQALSFNSVLSTLIS